MYSYPTFSLQRFFYTTKPFLPASSRHDLCGMNKANKSVRMVSVAYSLLMSINIKLLNLLPLAS